MMRFIAQVLIFFVLLFVYMETEYSHPALSRILAVALLILGGYLLSRLKSAAWTTGYENARGESKRGDLMWEDDRALFGGSPSRMRRVALERGGDPERWVPTFMDLGRLDGGGTIKLNYSFAIASRSDLLFYDCDPALYDQRALRDPFSYARRYNGRVPIDSIERVLSGVVHGDTVTRTRRSGFWSDLALGKTIGAVVGGTPESVTMAALVLIKGVQTDTSKAPYLIFGIPHAQSVGGGSFDFVGDLLPDSLATALEIGSLVHEYAQAGNADEQAGVNAETVALGLLSLMGGGYHAHGDLPASVGAPVAKRWVKS